MPVALKKDQTRRIKGTETTGIILDVQYHKEAEELEGLLEYQQDGETHTRWTKESELVAEEVDA